MFIYFLWHIVVKSHGLRMILTDLQEKNNLKPGNENLTESHRYIYIFKVFCLFLYIFKNYKREKNNVEVFKL